MLAAFEDTSAPEKFHDGDLGPTLVELYRAAQRQWPTLSLDDERFAAWLAERVDEQTPLSALHTDDLYLACACVHDSPGAVAAFERTYGREIDGGLSRLGPAVAADARDRLRDKLLTHVGGPPKLTRYAGRGKLLHWLRITVVRARTDEHRGAARGIDALALDTLGLARAVSPVTDPELAYLKSHYAELLAETFAEAVRALPPRQRTHLRQHIVGGLSATQLAKVYSVDKSTAKRWLAKAREELWKQTRRRVMNRLGLRREEFASIVRLVASELDISMARLLDTGGASGGTTPSAD